MPKPRPSRRDILKSAAALPFVYTAALRAAARRPAKASGRGSAASVPEGAAADQGVFAVCWASKAWPLTPWLSGPIRYR